MMQETILPTEEEITQDLKEKKKKQRRKGKASRKKKRAPSLTVVIGQITKQRGPKSYGIEQI